MALLLACIRWDRGYASTTQPSRCVDRGLDWDRVGALARHHKVLPLVYRALRRECPDLVPGPVLERMAEAYHQNQVLSRAMSREVVRIIRELEAAGLPAMPMRGPALAEAVYGDLAARQFCDIDILVRRSDAIACEQVLQRLGYTSLWPCPVDSPIGRLLADRDKGITLAHPARAWELDAHWRFAERCFPCPPDPDAVWNRATRAALEGRELLCFSAEDLLLTLVCHGTRHAWGSIGLIVDMAEAVRAHPHLRWEHIGEEFRRFHCVRIFHVALLMVGLVADATVPDVLIEEALSDRAALRHTRGVWRRLAVQGDVPDEWEGPIFCYHVRDRRRDRLRYALGLAAFPSLRDRRLAKLRPSFVGTYSVMRRLRRAGLLGSLVYRSMRAASHRRCWGVRKG